MNAILRFLRKTWGFFLEAASWTAGMAFLSWSPTDLLYGILVSTFFQSLRYRILETLSFGKHQKKQGDTRHILGATDVIPVVLLYVFFAVCVVLIAALFRFPRSGAGGILRPLAVIASVSAVRFVIDLVLRVPLYWPAGSLAHLGAGTHRRQVPV